MALQTEGQISLNEIHQEVVGTSGTQCSINDADIRTLIDATANSEMSFSDFYGLDGSLFEFTTSSPQTLPSPSSGDRFMQINARDYINAVNVISRITLNFNAADITSTLKDFTEHLGYGYAHGLDTVTGPTYSYSHTNNISKIEARWVFSNMYINFHSATSDDTFKQYHLAGQTGEQVTTLASGPNDINPFNNTGSFVDITPTRFGGTAPNSQHHQLEARADHTGNYLDEVELRFRNGGYVELQLKVTRKYGGSVTVSYRKSAVDHPTSTYPSTAYGIISASSGDDSDDDD